MNLASRRCVTIVSALLAFAPAASAGAPVGLTRRELGAMRREMKQAVTPMSCRKMEALELKPISSTPMLPGARDKLLVQSTDGRKFLFKPIDPKSTWLERERGAFLLRRAAGEPSLPIFATRIQLHNGRVLAGRAAPWIDGAGALPADVRQWSEAEKAGILADHVAAELLGNYDTKTEQSLVRNSTRLGQPMALNTDWDLSFTDYASKERAVSRHKAMNAAPPAHNLLYARYVRGDVALDFTPMRDAIERWQKVDDATFRRALEPLANKLFAETHAGPLRRAARRVAGRPADHGSYGPYQTADQFVSAVLARKANLRVEFERFVADLERERSERMVRKGGLPSLRLLWSDLRDKKMLWAGEFIDSPAMVGFTKLARRVAGDARPESWLFR